jgi:HK97 family phage prohead protease
MAGFLISLAAAKAGQRKWGARALDWKCEDDDEKLLKYATRSTSSEEAARFAITKSYEAAERLVDEYWPAIEWFAGVLERLGDHAEDLKPLLRHIKPVAREVIQYRHGFVSSEHWLRRGLARPNCYDPESREIDAVLSTGQAVRRQDWDGPFDEVLAMGPRNIRMQRLNAGAAVLDSHSWDKGLEARLGGVVPGSARIESGALLARIKFSRGSPLAQRVVQDLQDGLQIPLSLGYKVHKSEENKRTNPITRTAVDWEPIEVSVVPVGAEVETGFRQIAA